LYISKVLSNLGAWESFQDENPSEYGELCKIIESIHIPKIPIELLDIQAKIPNKLRHRPLGVIGQFHREFKDHGWTKKILALGSSPRYGLSSLDSVKEKVGVSVSFAQFAFAESNIFVKFPIFIRSGKIKMAFLIMPMGSLAKDLNKGAASFEMVERRLKEVSPFLPRFPFAVIGISSEAVGQILVEEFTSHLDLFLTEAIGFTILELKLNLERPNCDFKEMLPPRSDDIAKIICAFANYPKGGVLLVGVRDNGKIIGLPRTELDTVRERIGNINRSNLKPNATLEFYVFAVENDSSKCMLAVKILEVDRKPCMFADKVFIRDTTSSVAANSEQIRKLILGSSK
jgi:hypothetical protein